MKVLIDNCVPLNNGDAALVFSLKQKFGNDQVHLSTLNFDDVEEKYPKFHWIPSYINTSFYKFSRRVPLMNLVWKSLIAIKLLSKNNPYNKSDVIISAPGGYIHSYYGIESRLFILYFCKKYLKKTVGIYSQSIGNLNEKDRKYLVKYGKNLDFILTRDEISYNRATTYGLNNIELTKDAAFMLNTNATVPNNVEDNRVAISLRGWSKEGRNKGDYFTLINSLVESLLSKGYKIDFLSTCQGIEGYVDDSIEAKQFLKEYKYEGNINITVIDKYFTLDELQDQIKNYKFIFGTRLHMCILALINGVPAFNISYEEKGKECYKYLQIEKFSVDYNETNINENIESFLNLKFSEKERIFNRVKEVSDEQNVIFGSLKEKYFS